MSGNTPHYRLCLVPLNDDGTISETFLRETSPPPPAFSPERPLDETTARSLILAEIDAVAASCRRLERLAEVLPVPEDQDAMFDDRIPRDVVTNIDGAITFVLPDYLRPAIEHLRGAATATEEDLRREFDERHARYRAERRRRSAARGTRARRRAGRPRTCTRARG